ncbi:MAG: radical SAM protein [Parcubacteria group bacterium]|nr:B12-binding domain-containing radical SAM protein [Patescibacteria group bacterium]
MINKVKVLFINPSPTPLVEQEMLLTKQPIGTVPDFAAPIGMIEIASYVRNKIDNVEFRMLDIAKDLHVHYLSLEQKEPISLDGFYKEKLDELNYVPDIIGISILYSTSYKSSLRLVRLVRDKWPDSLITVGGNHATSSCDVIFKDTVNIDYVFRGEAEISFTEFLLKYVSDKTDKEKLAGIKGVYNKKKYQDHSKVYGNSLELSEMIQDLDAIGLPAYDLLDLDVYRRTSNKLGQGAISIMTERGCPFKCSFCSTGTVHGKLIRSKSNERILKDILYLKNKEGFKRIIIQDDLFAAKRQKFIELESMISKNNLHKERLFSLPNGLSVAVMTEEIIDKIYSMGVDFFRVAIESGSTYTQQKIIKKNVDLEKARKIIKYMRTKDLPIETNFILGFPGETKELMQETINYIDTIDVDWVHIFAALPLPGSELFYQFAKIGAIDPNNFDWDMCRYPLRNFDTKEISAKDLADLVYDTNIYTNFFNNKNMRCGRYERAINYFNNMVLVKYPFHIPARYSRFIAYDNLGKKEHAIEDLRICAKLISTNNESLKLWNRYNREMPLLTNFIRTGKLSNSI